MKKIYKVIFVIMFSAFCVCFVKAQDVPRSYYVRATGNDQNNNGRTENTPFKTIKRAIEVASQGAIRRITVIGTLNQSSEGGMSNDGVFVFSNDGDEELTITGKVKSTQQEKAVLSATGTKKRCVAIRGAGKIRFENIEISGANTTVNGSGITGPYNSPVILGNNTKIIGNVTTRNGGGIYASGNWTIEAGVEITGNKAANGGGVFIPYSWSKFTMQGGNISNNNASSCGGGIYLQNGSNSFTMENGDVSNNVAGSNGGGIYMADKATVINGKVCNNLAKKNGGGVYMGWDYDVGYSTSAGADVGITTCVISGNKSEFGAGIYINIGKLTFAGGNITNNKADFVGGGIYNGEKGLFNQSGGDISKNEAGDGSGADIFKKGEKE